MESAAPMSVEITGARSSWLSISWLPWLPYDAAGGGGSTRGTVSADGRRVEFEFDAAQLKMPPLHLVPGLAHIEITPKSLRGWVDLASGEARLEYDARFELAGAPLRLLAPLWRPPPLEVATALTTEAAARGGGRAPLRGRRRGADGRAVLVGAAVIPATGADAADVPLRLPARALAHMPVRLLISAAA
jgi:hypothetical protein